MAVVITPFFHQNILVGTPFSFDIDVSGNPIHVSVEGRLKGFKYHWTGTHIEWRGISNSYAVNEEVIIIADNERYTGTFSIVPITPIISDLSPVNISRGIQVSIPIPITGHVTDLVIRGPWIGLEYRLTEENNGELYGTVQSSSNFTQRTFNYNIIAYNNVGNQSVFDTANLMVQINT